MCAAASRPKASCQSASRNTAAPSKKSVGPSSQSNAPSNTNTSNYSTATLLPETAVCSEVLETIIDSVDLQSASPRDPDLAAPFYTDLCQIFMKHQVPESPPKPTSTSSAQKSPRQSRIPRPVDPVKSVVRPDYFRSQSPVQSTRLESPSTKSPRSESPTKCPAKSPKCESPEKHPTKSPRCDSPGNCPAKSPRSESPKKCPAKSPKSKSPRSESPVKCPAKSPRCESPLKYPSSKGLGKSPRSGSPVKRQWSENPANSRNAVWPTKAGVPRKGGNLDAIFCLGEKAFGTPCCGKHSWIKVISVSAPGGPDYARSEETLLSATEKSHNGYASGNTSRTTMKCACDDDDDDEYEDDSSCDCECECEPPVCQVQCCCISCCPPPDTCNFFRIPPPMPCQQNFQQNGCQGSPQCSTQPQPSCDNQQFSQGKHLEEKWEKEQKTEMKVCYCSSYRSAFGPKTRCGPSCTIKVTKQETKTTRQEIKRDGPPCTTSVNPAQRCFSGDGNHCPDDCTNWCNCDVRLNQNLTCFSPPRVVPNIPQLSSGYAIPCVNPIIGMPCHTNNCDSENGRCR
nr:unnamed protein product [Callosobruchus analis]